MKKLLFVAIAALAVGGVYHEEVADYFGELTGGSGGSGSIASFAWTLDAIRRLHVELHQAMKAEVDHVVAHPNRTPLAA